MLGIFFAAAVSLAATPAAAKTMTITVYSDGLSCPGDCDAHVVMSGKDNGTRNAFRPDSSRDKPEKCVDGQACRICFSARAASCMTVTYRGSGPPAGTFDFTPAFFDQSCADPKVPAELKATCDTIASESASSAYRNKTNCLAEPQKAECHDVIATADAAKAADAPGLKQCLAAGEDKFNKTRPDAEKRSQGCYYSYLSLGGPNSAGTTWQKLLPASCGPGGYVGRDGTDCCTKSIYSAIQLAPECSAFFVRRPK